MKLRCPSCTTTFQAKANSRTIKCPKCGARDQAPDGGWQDAPEWRKGKVGKFTRVEEGGVAAGTPAWSTGKKAAVAVVLVALLVGAGWYFTRGDTNGPAANAAGTVCGVDSSTITLQDVKDPVVEINTSAGCMAAEIYSTKAPVTAKNFLTYVGESFYDGLHFYRIVPGFVNQGGGESDQKTATHAAIIDEAATTRLLNSKYTLAMARTDTAASATTEFFINAKDNCSLDTTTTSSCPGSLASPDGYAVFGILVLGRDVSDAINAMQAPPGPTITSIRVVAITSKTPTAERNPVCPSVPNAPLPAPSAGVELDLITPGVWNVCSTTESQYVWIHNNGTAALDYAWSLTGESGAALPAGWSASFAAPAGTIAGHGATNSAWAATVATLHVPAGTPAQNLTAELHAAGATRTFTFHVQADLGRVTAAGQHIQTHYDLDDSHGNAVQHNGDFCVTLGAGTNAVPGYGWGLIGLAKGETVTLFVPPPFAYGYGDKGLAGKTLVWKATIMGYSDLAPNQNSQCPQAT